MPNLRERTRRAVQLEIGEAAVRLFAERGYEATTIDDIAAAVGMSKRSVFRYFATKEDIVVGKFEVRSGRMLEILRARPLGEPVWVSLRRVLDVVDEEGDTRAVQRMVFETPALLGVYLRLLQGMQEPVAAELVTRAEAAGIPYAAEDPAPRAVTAAAFACLVVAQQTWLAADGSLAGHLDRAMAAVQARA
ncbi:TetR family transcriptional regulator [Actinoplanes sp. LDG1-06]|uniref:TetR family transcriptional regulator n=1 Tax=Paractinoplanes ovalisporus TaxID=2810368 RepID=A0ABS2AP64_9ACTN|nr:TetR/AcrR family transcriptional regulator [Actinoplanes ovalisporus]MBM2621550.1 TetR family transcriptional regulator [Actinoplanes ovalisporus]